MNNDDEWADLAWRVRRYARRKYGDRATGITIHLERETEHREPFPEDDLMPRSEMRPKARWDSGGEPKQRDDWRAVYWPGFGQFMFSPLQARVMRLLWEAWEREDPPIAQRVLLDAAGSDCERLVDLFRRNPAWGKIIVPGDVPGTYQLVRLELGEVDQPEGAVA